MYDKYRTQIKTIEHELNENTDMLESGISIVIPVYDGIDYISTCLNSILNQEINNARYEVIIILNGKFLDDINHIYSNIDTYSDTNLTVLINDESSAGAARNLGINYAKYTHVTFIDIDDFISPSFIQSSYDLLETETILYTQIFNIIDDEIENHNSLNFEVLNTVQKKTASLMDLNKISTITACKIIPKKFLLTQKFRTSLKSGEDTVYFCELFANNRPNLKVIPIEEDVVYYRVIRENSVSRKENSYDFLILQRIEILEILDELYSVVKNKQVQRLIRSKYSAQIVFMNNYIKDNIHKHSEVINVINQMNLKHFDYSILNRDLAKKLVVSYCFPPYSDTSATIIAKRILEKNEIVDVISNNMNRIRKKEYSLQGIVKHLIGKNTVSNTQASFSNMFYLSKYIDDAFNMFMKNMDSYQEIYSRAMFPISHFPPLFMKILKPDVKWTAEFSDPLLVDINSKVRYTDIDNNNLVRYLSRGILGRFSKYVDNNLFNLMEIIPFAIADELVFTNSNQMESMIKRFKIEEKEFIRNKSKILKHPTLENKYYELANSDFKFDGSVINIGYFGNFYKNRSYHHFIKLIDYLNKNFNYQFKLHLFTNMDAILEEEINHLNSLNINVYPYISFLEFLNTTKKLDFLLINDAQTLGIKESNPYLPSKLSDYLGSNTPVIGFVEPGSIMCTEDNGIIKINVEKIDYNNFEIPDFNFSEIESEVLKIKNKNDRNYLIYNTESTVLKRGTSKITVSSDLRMDNLTFKEWMIKPLALPIKMKDTFTLYYENNSDIEQIVGVQGFYSVKNVIQVYIDYNGETSNENCITKFRDIKEISIQPKQFIKIKLKYKKYYNQKGFIEAGRLKLINL